MRKKTEVSFEQKKRQWNRRGIRNSKSIGLCREDEQSGKSLPMSSSGHLVPEQYDDDQDNF